MSMGATNREITVYNCDAEDCKVVKPVIEGGNYPESFITGTVNVTTDPTGRTEEWAACKVAHIGKAVTAVKAAAQPEQAEPAQQDGEAEDAKTESGDTDEEPPPYSSNAALNSGEYV